MASVKCAIGKCYVPKDNATCYYPDSLKECCKNSTEIVCGSKPRGSCNIDGVIYNEGEKFQPKDSCLYCLCSQKDNYKFNKSSCRREICDIAATKKEDFENYCAPLYGSKTSCCPDSFVCPEGIRNSTSVSNGTTSKGVQCKFGDKNYNKGDKFSSDSINCECLVPPYLTCITQE